MAFVGLLISRIIGNFAPAPNHEHAHTARRVLAEGYPTIAIWSAALDVALAAQVLVLLAGSWCAGQGRRLRGPYLPKRR